MADPRAGPGPGLRLLRRQDTWHGRGLQREAAGFGQRSRRRSKKQASRALNSRTRFEGLPTDPGPNPYYVRIVWTSPNPQLRFLIALPFLPGANLADKEVAERYGGTSAWDHTRARRILTGKSPGTRSGAAGTFMLERKSTIRTARTPCSKPQPEPPRPEFNPQRTEGRLTARRADGRRTPASASPWWSASKIQYSFRERASTASTVSCRGL